MLTAFLKINNFDSKHDTNTVVIDNNVNGDVNIYSNNI